MSQGDPVAPSPSDSPKAGEVWRHYKKGDLYKIVDIALNSDDEWSVVYAPMYEGAVARLFTRPVAQWREAVEWQGSNVERFTRVD